MIFSFHTMDSVNILLSVAFRLSRSTYKSLEAQPINKHLLCMSILNGYKCTSCTKTHICSNITGNELASRDPVTSHTIRVLNVCILFWRQG